MRLPMSGPTVRFPRIMAALAAIIPSMKASEALALDEAFAADALKEAKPVEDEFPDMNEDMRNAAMDAYCAKMGKDKAKLTAEDKREAFKAAKDGRPATGGPATGQAADEEHTSELQSRPHLVC